MISKIILNSIKQILAVDVCQWVSFYKLPCTLKDTILAFLISSWRKLAKKGNQGICGCMT